MSSKIISQDKKDGMVSSYLSGKTAKESASQFDLSYSCCLRELRKRKIPIRGSRDSVYKKYSLDENVFETINTEEKAYWLGFIMADGYVTPKNHFAIRLCLADIGHIEKLKNFIKSNHLIKKINAKIKDKTYPACGLFIGCKKIVSDLSNFGIIPNKTETAAYPQNIPIQLERHFWRGYFDGDGCISFSVAKGRTVKNWSVSAVGKEQIIIDFENFVKKHVKTDATRKKRKNTSLFTFGVGGVNLCQPILKILYENSNIYLDRKFKLYEQCISQKVLRTDTSFLTPEFLTSEYEKCGRNWDRVADKIGIHSNTLLRARRRLKLSIEKVGGNSKKILVFNQKGELAGEFESVDEAAIKFGVARAAIWAICRGRNKRTKTGYVFKYRD